MSLQTIVFVTLSAMLVFWSVGAYNRLVRLKNIIANAFGQIDIELKRRYDFVLNLVEFAKKYLQPEQETLQALTAACTQARSASDAVRSRLGKADAVSALAAAEQTLDGCLERLFAVAELKADSSLQELGEELANAKNKLGFARQAYNDAVLNYNNAQRQFPTLLIARLCGFTLSAMLPATGSALEAPADRLPT
jgi:LemA protein